MQFRSMTQLMLKGDSIEEVEGGIIIAERMAYMVGIIMRLYIGYFGQSEGR